MEQMVHPDVRYPYSTRKSFLIFGLVLFGGGGIFLSYLSWSQREPVLVFFALISFLLIAFGILNSLSKAEILLFQDKVIIPYGFRYRKQHVISFSEITAIDEITINQQSSLRLSLKTRKPILVPESMMEETHFYDLIERLERSIVKNEPQYNSPIEIEVQKRKIKLWKSASLALPILVIVVSRLFTDQLKTLNDWLSVFGIVGLILSIEVVSSFLFKKFGFKKRTTTSLSRIEAKRLKSRWNLIAYTPSIFSFLLLFLLIKLPHEGTTNIWPFISYSTLSVFVVFLTLKQYLPNVDGVMTTFEQGMGYVVNAVFLGIVLVFGFIVININFDNSKGAQKDSYLTDMFIPDKLPRDKCFRIAHWDTGKGISAGDSAYCTYTYPGLMEKDKVSFILKDGFLREPWIDSVEILKYRSADSFIKDLGNDLDLRFANIQYFAKRDGGATWDKYFEEWNSKCQASQFEYCRLASYIYHQKDDLDKARLLVRRGCDNRDFFSCYNVFSYTEFDKAYQEKAKSIILKSCTPDLVGDKKEVCEVVSNFKNK